jgi:hypothetical protein
MKTEEVGVEEEGEWEEVEWEVAVETGVEEEQVVELVEAVV